MKRKRYIVLIAFALFAAAASLTGCGTSSTSASGQQQVQTAKASVTIAAQFPTTDGAVKSLLPAGAQAIEVYAQPLPYNANNSRVLVATLTPAQPSTKVQLAPGMYQFDAVAYDSADTAARSQLGATSTGGEVVSGQANSVVLTFMNGQWTIVDAADAPAPIVLSDGTQLIDMVIQTENYYYPAQAAKSAIDYAKPNGYMGSMVRLRFNNNTSARTYGWMVSQFSGAANSNAISSDSYNLTRKCRSNNYDYNPGQTSCEDSPGDKIVMISSNEYQSGNYYGGTLLYGSTDDLMPNRGMTSFTQNGAAIDLMKLIPETSVTGGNRISGSIVEWNPNTARTLSLGTTAQAAKSTTAVKAQSANTPYSGLTVKQYETLVCANSKPQNRGAWPFANNTSAGKVMLGGRVCYTSSFAYLGNSSSDAGDYTYGLVPSDPNNLGDYCHVWDFSNNVCTQQRPGPGDVYRAWNFFATKTPTKTAIDYGSFKLNFWGERAQSGTAYVYPFRAKGSTTVTPAKK